MKAGELISGAQIPFVLGALICGPITEKLFRGRPRILVVIGFFVCMAFCLLQLRIVYTSALIVAACLWGVSFAMSVIAPQIMTFVSKSYPERIMGKMGGILIGGSTLGGVIGAALSAYALHATGQYKASIGLFSLGSFIGFLCAFKLTSAPLKHKD